MQDKYQSSALLVPLTVIHRWISPVDSPLKEYEGASIVVSFPTECKISERFENAKPQSSAFKTL